MGDRSELMAAKEITVLEVLFDRKVGDWEWEKIWKRVQQVPRLFLGRVLSYKGSVKSCIIIIKYFICRHSISL